MVKQFSGLCLKPPQLRAGIFPVARMDSEALPARVASVDRPHGSFRMEHATPDQPESTHGYFLMKGASARADSSSVRTWTSSTSYTSDRSSTAV